MKKLDKEQTNAVVDVIYNKVSPALRAKADKEYQAEEATILKTMKAHPLYKEIIKIFSMAKEPLKLIVEIPVKHITEMWGNTTQEQYKYTVRSLEDLTKQVLAHSSRKVRFNEFKIKQDIKAQLILASIDATDLQQLIDSVVKLFK